MPGIIAAGRVLPTCDIAAAAEACLTKIYFLNNALMEWI
jgi:hypothetical protein